jgi:hypothetical protein
MFPVLKSDETGTSTECSDVGPVMFPVLKSDDNGKSTECSDAEPVQSVVMFDQYIVK